MKEATKKILDRITKLLAMGNGTANENEAAIAMRRALFLIGEYNLRLGDFEDVPEDNDVDRSDYSRKRGGPWARSVCYGIAQLYFCEYFYTNMGKRHDIHTFVGTETNRKVAEMVAAFVLDVIDGEAKRTAVSDPRTGTKTPYINSFRNAAGNRVYWRCDELVKEASKDEIQEGGSNLPVLASMYSVRVIDNRSWIDDNIKLGKEKKSRARSTSSAGVTNGRVSGDKVSLRPMVK